MPDDRFTLDVTAPTGWTVTARCSECSAVFGPFCCELRVVAEDAARRAVRGHLERVHPKEET